MEINKFLENKIIRHIKQEYPRESCGLIVIKNGKRIYHECKNISEVDTNFILDPRDYAAAADKGTIEAVVHSHPNLNCQPSNADREMCKRGNIPWVIYSYPNINHTIIYPDVNYKADLVGRDFVHGIFDCYSIIKDYYCDHLHIDIPDFNRDEEWWLKGQDIYVENFEKAGFIEVKDGTIQKNDVLLMKIASPVLNHGAIYLGDNILLHHIVGRLSSKDVYGGYYQKITEKVLRHVKNC